MNETRPTFRRELSPDDRQVAVVFVVSAFAHAIALYLLLGVPAPIERPTPVHIHAQESPVVVPIAYFDVQQPDPIEEPEPIDEPVDEPAQEPVEIADAAPAPADATPAPAEIRTPTPPEVAPEPEEAPVEIAEAPQVVAAPEVEAVVTSTDTDAPVMVAAPEPDQVSGPQASPPSPTLPAIPELAAVAPGGNGAGGHGTNTAPERGHGDVDGLRARYHQQLSRRLARLQNSYSPSLQRLMVEGTVIVSIILDERGRIVDVVLARSSGDPRLDEHAVDQVRRLRRLVSPPPELGLAARTIELPISYELQG